MRRLQSLVLVARRCGPRALSTAPRRVPPPGVTIVDSPSSAQHALSVLRSLPANTFHACDTETTGIDVKRQSPVGNGRVICASIYSGPDVDFGAGPQLWIDNLDSASGTLDLFAPWLQDPEVEKVWHNYSFDRHVLFNHGIRVRGFGGDTMHMARLWNAARTVDGGYSLEALSFELLGKRKRPIMERFGRPKLRKDGTPGKVLEFPDLEALQRGGGGELTDWIDYCCYDTLSTWELRRVLQERLEAMPWDDAGAGLTMYDFYRRYWRPFGELLCDMEERGIHVRVSDGYLPGLRERALADHAAAAGEFRAWAREQCHDAAFMNIQSDAQKQQFFFAPYAGNRRGENALPAEREFMCDNTDGYIEPGRTQPKRQRPFRLHGLGLPVDPKKTTKSGKPAVSLEVLRGLAAQAGDLFGGGEAGARASSAIDALCRVSAIETLVSSFIEPLIEGADAGGRIHCSLNLNTETGRLSARRPNLQNQPALEKDIYKIRDAFACRPEDGTSFVVADFGQLELRVLAHMSRCRSMLEAFRLGGDFHSRTAIGMYPQVREAVDRGDVLLEWDYPDGREPPVPLVKDVFGSERRKAKVLNFSLCYGKTAMGLAQDWGVTRAEAEETIARWYADRPEVKAWQEETIAMARETRATRTLMGRYRPLPDIVSANRAARAHAERAAINGPIQSSAADIVMMAMLNVNASERLRDLGWKLLLQIHDELICEGPSESSAEAMAEIVRCMENPFARPLLVDLTVDAKCEQTWYAAK